MKIVVLAGGLSPERDVSFSSGSLIANALIENGHDVALVDSYLGVETEDFATLFVNKSMDVKFRYRVGDIEPDLEQLKKDSGYGDCAIGPHVIDICRYADVVFNALHGGIGEDGQLQAVLNSFDVVYTGSGFEGALLAMDKNISKQLMVVNKIPTPDWIEIDRDYNESVLDAMELPCVVKPCSCGSSVGVTIVSDREQLKDAIKVALGYEDKIIIEKKITGREFSVGILDNEALPPIEIIPENGFYNYMNKYQLGRTEEVCPAAISKELTERLEHMTQRLHKIHNLGGYSRADFIVDEHDDIYCLEVNTLPGMTPASLLPQEARSVGITFSELCEKIVNMAVNK